jgi:hypothetical protein
MVITTWPHIHRHTQCYYEENGVVWNTSISPEYAQIQTIPGLYPTEARNMLTTLTDRKLVAARAV